MAISLACPVKTLYPCIRLIMVVGSGQCIQKGVSDNNYLSKSYDMFPGLQNIESKEYELPNPNIEVPDLATWQVRRYLITVYWSLEDLMTNGLACTIKT